MGGEFWRLTVPGQGESNKQIPFVHVTSRIYGLRCLRKAFHNLGEAAFSPGEVCQVLDNPVNTDNAGRLQTFKGTLDVYPGLGNFLGGGGGLGVYFLIIVCPQSCPQRI